MPLRELDFFCYCVYQFFDVLRVPRNWARACVAKSLKFRWSRRTIKKLRNFNCRIFVEKLVCRKDYVPAFVGFYYGVLSNVYPAQCVVSGGVHYQQDRNRVIEPVIKMSKLTLEYKATLSLGEV